MKWLDIFGSEYAIGDQLFIARNNYKSGDMGALYAVEVVGATRSGRPSITHQGGSVQWVASETNAVALKSLRHGVLRRLIKEMGGADGDG